MSSDFWTWVVTDGAGNVYPAGPQNSRFRKVETSDKNSTIAESGVTGFVESRDEEDRQECLSYQARMLHSGRD